MHWEFHRVIDLDGRIKELTAEAEGLFDNPDLHQYGVCRVYLTQVYVANLPIQYDLRAVIMHDGLFGRSHVYCYTKDSKGSWWKIVDYQVSEVRLQ